MKVSKWRLALEIAMAYPPSLRLLASNDLAQGVAASRRPPRKRAWDADSELPRTLGRGVVRLLRRLPTDNRCLVRAFVALRVLSHHGVPATLVIGVKREGAILAHAWVEVAGSPVLPPLDYLRLQEL